MKYPLLRILAVTCIVVVTVTWILHQAVHGQVMSMFGTYVPESMPAAPNDPRYVTVDTKGKTKVFQHDGLKFEKLNDFCTWTREYECYKIQTPVGLFPFFVHDNGTDHHMSDPLRTGWEFYKGETNNIIKEIRKMKNNPMFVDIGANLGLYSMVITNTLKIPSLLVEPIVENVVRLCKTIQENNLTENMTVFYNAVSNEHKTVGFFKFKNHYGGSRVIPLDNSVVTGGERSCERPTSVKTCTLDDLLPYMKSRQAFLKVDVESHEYEVIHGGQKFLDEIDVPAMFMEWHWVKQTPRGKPLAELLRKRNYVAYPALGDTSGPHLDFANPTIWPENILWLKRQ